MNAPSPSAGSKHGALRLEGCAQTRLSLHTQASLRVSTFRCVWNHCTWGISGSTPHRSSKEPRDTPKSQPRALPKGRLGTGAMPQVFNSSGRVRAKFKESTGPHANLLAMLFNVLVEWVNDPVILTCSEIHDLAIIHNNMSEHRSSSQVQATLATTPFLKPLKVHSEPRFLQQPQRQQHRGWIAPKPPQDL